MEFNGLAEMLASRTDAPPAPAPNPAPTPMGTPVADPQAATIQKFQEDQASTPNPTAANAPTYAPGSDISSSFINASSMPPIRTPVKSVMSSHLLGLLSNFGTGMGEAMMKFAGVETPLQRIKTINDIQESQLVQQQHSLQNQMTARRLAMMGNNQDIEHAVAPLGQLSDEEQAVMNSARMQAAMTGTLAPVTQAVTHIMTTRSTESRAQAANELRKDPIKGLMIDALSAAQKGDDATFQSKLGMIRTLGAAKKAQIPNEIQLIQQAQGGDPEAQKTLDTLQQRKVQLAGAQGYARGKGYGMWRLSNYYDPETGEIGPMFGIDVLQAKQAGKQLVPAGNLQANTMINLQRLNSEAAPAIQSVRENLGAFDNAHDRAIFARIAKENPMSEYGDPHTWMGNVIDQSLKAGLSPEGQRLAVRLGRMNETVSLLRSTLGLPATNSATALTLRMLPGAATPNSGYAKDQLDQIEQVIKQAGNVPILGNRAGRPGAPGGSRPPLSQFEGKR